MKEICWVYFNYEHIPRFMTNRMSDWFIKNRHSVVKVFNNHIEEVNKKWELTGEPYSFGDYLEDINPEYVKEIQKTIQPFINVGYIPFIKKSKLWMTIKEL